MIQAAHEPVTYQAIIPIATRQQTFKVKKNQ